MAQRVAGEVVGRSRSERFHDVEARIRRVTYLLDEIVPIPGTKRIRYLDENAAAAEIELPEEVLTRLNSVAPAGRAVGDRNITMERLNL